jgi:hypothetical protein
MSIAEQSPTTTWSGSRRSVLRLLAAAAVAIPAGGVVAVAGVAPAADGATPSVTAPINRAKGALSLAKTQLSKRQYAKAIDSLRLVRVNSASAHQAALALIGKPPTDPESDEPPGPAAVLAVLSLAHLISVEVVKMFAGMKSHPRVVDALLATLLYPQRRRDTMIAKIIALPAEGAGADYADDLSDTVPTYAQEIAVTKAALTTYQLSAAGRTGLRQELARVTATRNVMTRAFGDE